MNTVLIAHGLRLSHYKDLIRNLPYLDQAFETKRSTWNKECTHNENFRNFCDRVFEKPVVKFSRGDLFMLAQENVEAALISIIFWGYPRNMRGNSFASILSGMEHIIRAFDKQERNISQNEFEVICNQLSGKGIGLSTLTKFLYFFKYELEGYPCLILDSRIIEVINEGLYEELSAITEITEFNKKRKYSQYLKVMTEIAKAESYKPDQLEFFLFMLGKNLKTTVAK